MEILKSKEEEFNYPESCKSLFEAMKQGKIIKSITCTGRSKDFILKDVKCYTYYVSASKQGMVNYDSVDIEAQPDSRNNKILKDKFYMHWVKSFELY